MSEPSWTTALSEAKSAARHLDQAARSLESLSRELKALREMSALSARIQLANALTEGSDGGVLQSLMAAASENDSAMGRTAQILLERLKAALGLEAIGQRGEFLCLAAEELGEFMLRGPGRDAGEERSLYCVIHPGWCIEGRIVARPLVEAVEP